MVFNKQISKFLCLLYHLQNIILRTTLPIFQDEQPSTSRGTTVEAQVVEEVNEKQVVDEEIEGDEMGHVMHVCAGGYHNWCLRPICTKL